MPILRPLNVAAGFAAIAVASLLALPAVAQTPKKEEFQTSAPYAILIEADRTVPRQMDGEVIDDGRSLHARIEPGTLVIRVPRPVATAA